jgi:S1-C subfamily serine protease
MTRSRRGPGLLVAAVATAAALLAAGCGSGPGPGEPGPGGSGPGASGPGPVVVRVTVAVDGLVPEVATGVAAGDGRVLTVAHPLSPGRAVRVGGRPARVVRLDRRLDLAVLAVPGLRAPALRLGTGGSRARIVVLRAARARSFDALIRRRVRVAFRDQPGDPPRMRPGLELAAAIDPGDSGAPLLDGRGRLLGVLYARSSDRAGTAWAVDAAAVRSLLAR